MSGTPAGDGGGSSGEFGSSALAGTAYRFIRVIGQGGMGTVAECEHVGLARMVVVKLLHSDLAERPDFVDRLRIEAQALARIEHGNLVRVTDFGVTPSGAPFLAMEKLEGQTLAELLRDRRWLPPLEAIDLVGQALDGLGAAHARGIIHRDIKPANLFVCDTPQGPRLKVLDFGIAKVLAEADLGGLAPKYRTQTGAQLGTPRYIAPEQLQGGVITPATDVYAMGLVLYRALVGKHPFSGLSVYDVYRAQLLEMPPPPSTGAPQPLPAELDRAVLRAISKSPSDRFATAEAFATELRRVARLGASGQISNAPSPVDSRSAPTVGTGPAGAGVALPQATLPLVPETLAGSEPTTRSPAHAVLAVLCLLSVLFALPWLVYLLASGTTILFTDPTAHALLPENEEEFVRFFRIAAGASLLEVALGAGLFVVLASIGIRLSRNHPDAARAVLRWNNWALAFLLPALPVTVLRCLAGVISALLLHGWDTGAAVGGAIEVIFVVPWVWALALLIAIRIVLRRDAV